VDARDNPNLMAKVGEEKFLRNIQFFYKDKSPCLHCLVVTISSKKMFEALIAQLL
jgi:hypothetical protein